jgi:S1-C subfamily serine protease
MLGDTIVTFDGVSVRAYDDLIALLSGDKVGQEVPAQIIRGGQMQEVKVAIGERQ